LTVLQSFSQGTSRYIQNRATKNQTETVGQLSKLLSILLPSVNKDDIANATKRYIDGGIALKNSLIEERAVYQFFWAAGGNELNPELVKVPAGETGVVGMCTFPGLVRKVKDEGAVCNIIVVKPIVKSLSSLDRK
jgi:hypothetical protein